MLVRVSGSAESSIYVLEASEVGTSLYSETSDDTNGVCCVR